MDNKFPSTCSASYQIYRLGFAAVNGYKMSPTQIWWHKLYSFVFILICKKISTFSSGSIHQLRNYLVLNIFDFSLFVIFEGFMPITVSWNTEEIGDLCISVFDFRVILISIETSSLDVERGRRNDDGFFFFYGILFRRVTNGLNGIGHFGRRFCRRACLPSRIKDFLDTRADRQCSHLDEFA